ncbi:MAG: hypothetical protein E6Q84_03545 [Thiothrix sp.]|jgi:Fic family protein|nr:MAG: hypothetical protein E6Q84_03545 [Thiothrix sp.]
MADNLEQQIIDLLANASQPLAFSEIYQQLPIAERTLSRWLMRLVASGQIQASGFNRGRRYFLAALPSAAVSPESLFSPESLVAINKVRQALIHREPCTYNKAWLDHYQVNHSCYLSDQQKALLRQHGKPTSHELPAGTYARKIFNRLLIDLSYNSARLEGNTYSLLDTEKLLINGIAADDKLDIEKVMLLNHKEAIRFLVDGIKRLETSSDTIRSLHFLLADGLVMPQDAGQIRRESVRVSSSTYLPIDNPERLSQQLELIMKKAGQIQDPFEQSFFLLVHLAYLQAFADVNKRTARLACNIPLIRNNLIPLSFNDIDKDDYLSAVLVSYEQNDIRPLADLYVWSYLRSCKNYWVTAEAIGVDLLRVQYRQFRRDVIREIVQRDLHDSALQIFIQNKIQQAIPAEHQAKCLADLQLDLENLAPWNIVGMGISGAELSSWLSKK